MVSAVAAEDVVTAMKEVERTIFVDVEVAAFDVVVAWDVVEVEVVFMLVLVLDDDVDAALGHNAATPSPSKNIPISVVLLAFAPEHAAFNVLVSAVSAAIHVDEQDAPSAKSDALQPLIGASYTAVHTVVKPEMAWNDDRLMVAEAEDVKIAAPKASEVVNLIVVYTVCMCV